MRQHFVEKNQLFSFGDPWSAVIQWDKHVAYKEGLKKVDRSKAVDFIGVLRRRQLVFLEMKDYRVHQRQNDENLLNVLHHKVRDTVAALTGVFRNDTYEDCRPFADALLNRQCPVRIYFWLEQPQCSDLLQGRTRRRRAQVAANARTQQHKQRVKWLNGRVWETNSRAHQDHPIPGLDVKELPTQLPARGRKVVEFLQERSLSVPPEVETELNALVVRDAKTKIDEWLCRAWEVSSAAELLQDG